MGNVFGECLRKFRRKKMLTQEQLAEAVGVSAQAVSKWEQGSYPDASLLPAVADCLGVTIDALFGREAEEPTLEGLLCRELNRVSEESAENGRSRQANMIKRAFEICHWFFYIFSSWGSVSRETQMTLESAGEKTGIFSLIRMDEGLIFAKLNSSLQYFLLMPKPAEGFDNPDGLAFDERSTELFRFLGKPEVLRVLTYLEEQPATQFFSLQTIVEELEIDSQKAAEVIAGLKEFSFVKQATFRKSEQNEEIYQYQLEYCFIFLMSFVHLILHLPNSFRPSVTVGQEPYFCNSTYKKKPQSSGNSPVKQPAGHGEK